VGGLKYRPNERRLRDAGRGGSWDPPANVRGGESWHSPWRQQL